MKKNYAFSLLLLFIFQLPFTKSFAQVPQKINYQSVVRNNAGAVLGNTFVTLRFSIHDGSPGGTIVYQEVQADTTTSLGLISFEIGNGSVFVGSFTNTNWGSGTKYLQVELDAAGGTNYTDMGTTQLLSVPYALYAENSGQWTKNGNDIHNANSGNVGIGTASPSALLHVNGGSAVFAANGNIPANPGNVPISGSGRRMMWYADKAALRVGYTYGAQWDSANIGTYSVAIGYSNTASGTSSIAMGYTSTAYGNTAVALGSSIAFGDYSVAIGTATANGNNSVALGGGYASGNFSFATGLHSIAPSSYETVLGAFNEEYIPNSASSWNIDDRLFVIGNGTGIATEHNALTILKNGKVGIGTTNPGQLVDVNGSVRQVCYGQSVTVPANGLFNFTWHHNLGYNPIIMLVKDQTNGGNMDYVEMSYSNLNTNDIQIFMTNRSGNAATGDVRWIIVY